MGQQAAASATWRSRNKPIFRVSSEPMGQHPHHQPPARGAHRSPRKILNHVFCWSRKKPCKIKGSSHRFPRYGMGVNKNKMTGSSEALQNQLPGSSSQPEERNLGTKTLLPVDTRPNG